MYTRARSHCSSEGLSAIGPAAWEGLHGSHEQHRDQDTSCRSSAAAESARRVCGLVCDSRNLARNWAAWLRRPSDTSGYLAAALGTEAHRQVKYLGGLPAPSSALAPAQGLAGGKCPPHFRCKTSPSTPACSHILQMPAYSEPEMLARAAGLLAPSLPRVVPRPPVPDKPLAENSRHEVVVIGTGPAGMFTAYLLARFGVSALAVDLVNTPLIPGHADGLQPRTLEVMQTLGLANQILSQCKVSVKCAFWNPAPDGSRHIERTTEVNDVDVATRYPFKVLLAAERVVNIIEKDMTRYGGKAERGVEFVDFELSDNDPEWPVRVHLRDVTTGREFSVVSKYLIGADGAHSRVREKMGVKLHGGSTLCWIGNVSDVNCFIDSNNSIWGVVDAVVKTDFPDIRKRCAIVREPSSPSQGPLLSLSMWQHSDAGSLMIIPREKIENGQYMTRFYTQLGKAEDSSDPTLRDRFKTQRVQMTLPVIMDQVKKVIAPYKLEVGYTDWWAAYVIGQRVAERFSLKDKKGRERVFIIGDACHTHSPKASAVSRAITPY